VKIVNETLAGLSLEKHPGKTFVGRVERGFDFLGYRLSPNGLTVARQTWKRFVERATRLYEQECAGRIPPGALGAYVRRWAAWAAIPAVVGSPGMRLGNLACHATTAPVRSR
jgi:hypothetical protein